jgi:hypothetical protein
MSAQSTPLLNEKSNIHTQHVAWDKPEPHVAINVSPDDETTEKPFDEKYANRIKWWRNCTLPVSRGMIEMFVSWVPENETGKLICVLCSWLTVPLALVCLAGALVLDAAVFVVWYGSAVITLPPFAILFAISMLCSPSLNDDCCRKFMYYYTMAVLVVLAVPMCAVVIILLVFATSGSSSGSCNDCSGCCCSGSGEGRRDDADSRKTAR